jgi:hypothetical protein
MVLGTYVGVLGVESLIDRRPGEAAMEALDAKR